MLQADVRTITPRPYGQRWQAEIVFSMIRNKGAVVAARTYYARNREMSLAVIVHNIGILCLSLLFCRACDDQFSQ